MTQQEAINYISTHIDLNKLDKSEMRNWAQLLFTVNMIDNECWSKGSDWADKILYEMIHDK